MPSVVRTSHIMRCESTRTRIIHQTLYIVQKIQCSRMEIYIVFIRINIQHGTKINTLSKSINILHSRINEMKHILHSRLNPLKNGLNCGMRRLIFYIVDYLFEDTGLTTRKFQCTTQI